jgi:hypothetical protein
VTCAPAASGVPHSPQNFASGSLPAPQLAQVTASGVPHSLQNFRPGSFCVPQLEHITV